MHKNSIWSEHIHHHVLVCKQVRKNKIIKYIYHSLFVKGELERRIWNIINGKPMFPEYSSNFVKIS